MSSFVNICLVGNQVTCQSVSQMNSLSPFLHVYCAVKYRYIYAYKLEQGTWLCQIYLDNFLDHIGQYWTILDLSIRIRVLDLFIWTCLFWPVYLDLSICSRLFCPVYLDPLCGPVIMDPSIWTELFVLIYLDPFFWTPLYGPIYLDPSIWNHLFRPIC